MNLKPEEVLTQMRKDVNEHAKIIQDTVFHTYPYNRIGFKSDAPHAEDCGGCIINAEVEKLVVKLEALSDTVKIAARLEASNTERERLRLDRGRAFEKAGVVINGPVSDLVETIINDRDQLAEQLRQIKAELNTIIRMY